MHDPLFASYLAGFIDGEGHISIHVLQRENGKFAVTTSVEFGCTNKDLMLEIASGLRREGFLFSWGEHHYPASKKRASYYKLCLRKRKNTIRFLSEIEPMLKLKRPQALSVIAYLSAPKRKPDRTKVTSLPEWVSDLITACKLRHRRGGEQLNSQEHANPVPIRSGFTPPAGRTTTGDHQE